MFPERLKQTRLERHLSQKELANRLYISQQAYARYENGTSSPNPDVMLKISQELNVSVDYLLGNTNIKKETPDKSDVTFDDFTYALHNETKELTEEKKQQLLEMAKFFKQQQDKEKGK